MKLLFSIILLAIPALSFAGNSLPAAEADIDSLSVGIDDWQNDKKICYEGNVTLGLTLGIGGFTSHGIRFERTRIAIGGTAGCLFVPGTNAMFVGAYPKWYFADGRKLDGFIACDIGAMIALSYPVTDYLPPDEMPDPYWHTEATIIPTIGLGIKFKNHMALEISIKAFSTFNREHISCLPLLGIGFRF